MINNNFISATMSSINDLEAIIKLCHFNISSYQYDYHSNNHYSQPPPPHRFVIPIFPSEDDDVITSPYNCLLALNKLMLHADCVLPVENQVVKLEGGGWLGGCVRWCF